MDRSVIEDKVRHLLIDDLELDEALVTPEARLEDDLGIDSLDFVDIVVIIHRDFGFKPTPQEMRGVKTVRQFCDYIESRVG